MHIASIALEVPGTMSWVISLKVPDTYTYSIPLWSHNVELIFYNTMQSNQSITEDVVYKQICRKPPNLVNSHIAVALYHVYYYSCLF